jgi:hypothetical protein
VREEALLQRRVIQAVTGMEFEKQSLDGVTRRSAHDPTAHSRHYRGAIGGLALPTGIEPVFSP